MAAVALLCLNCGAEFGAKRSHAKWCSDKCRMENARRRPPYNDAEIDDAIRLTVCPEDALIVALWRLHLEPAA